MSDVTVSVEFESSAFFAGEQIRCRITFTNTADETGWKPAPISSSRLGDNTTARDRWKDTRHLPNQRAVNDSSSTNQRLSTPLSWPPHGHRFAKSASHAVGVRRGPQDVPSIRARGGSTDNQLGHRRAVSIVSISSTLPQGNAEGVPDLVPSDSRSAQIPVQAASLQALMGNSEASRTMSPPGEDL